MKIHYSIETMDDKALCRKFNYHAIKSPMKRFLVRAYRQLAKQQDHYTLGDIYRMFSSGDTVQDIFKNHPLITMKAILISRAFFAHTHPEQYKKRKKEKLQIMFDENINIEHSIEGGVQLFGHSTHVFFENLVGAKDARLWGFLRARNIDVLITKDRAVKPNRKTKETLDITRCARLAWQRELKNNGGIVNNHIRKMPLILHVPHNYTGTQIKNLLRKHEDSIRELKEECSSPVIELTKGKAKHGIHFLEIQSFGFKKKIEKLRDKRVDVILQRFEIANVTSEEESKLKARLKRGIEHEISIELQARYDGQDKIIHLKALEDGFNAATYSYIEGDNVLQKVIKSAVNGDPLSKPAWQRYGRKNPALAA